MLPPCKIYTTHMEAVSLAAAVNLGYPFLETPALTSSQNNSLVAGLSLFATAALLMLTTFCPLYDSSLNPLHVDIVTSTTTNHNEQLNGTVDPDDIPFRYKKPKNVKLLQLLLAVVFLLALSGAIACGVSHDFFDLYPSNSDTLR